MKKQQRGERAHLSVSQPPAVPRHEQNARQCAVGGWKTLANVKHRCFCFPRKACCELRPRPRTTLSRYCSAFWAQMNAFRYSYFTQDVSPSDYSNASPHCVNWEIVTDEEDVRRSDERAPTSDRTHKYIRVLSCSLSPVITIHRSV